jgi:antitoxin (DNA-binding transcriptional repressor) of toxin-antitoxin stability system
MIGDMGTVHITEAELARDLHAILAKVQQGVEVVVEQDHRPVAVLRPLNRSGQLVSDILREARQHNSAVTLDEDFGNDLEEIIVSQQQPWNPPSWDRLRLLQFLKESGPGWNLEEHPELNEGAAQWVESLRREDESIDTETSTR